jgi:hypothetical protein
MNTCSVVTIGEQNRHNHIFDSTFGLIEKDRGGIVLPVFKELKITKKVFRKIYMCKNNKNI